MTEETTRPSLLSRIRDPQDGVAWREFDTKYRDLILRYCRRRGIQETDAEDVRQLVMLNLTTSLRSFNYTPARGRFRSYLGTAVRHAIDRHLGRTPKVLPLDSETALGIPADGETDRQWEEEWMNHHYRLALKTIRQTSDPVSAGVFDFLLSGKTVEEAAAAFKMSEAAVHKVKQRVRDRLKELIRAQIEDEDALERTA